MMDAVHRFEGTVNQVLGDGIMAIFGAPITHEDRAVRQLRLDPLPLASADELLQALLSGDAALEPLKQLLIERTGGNPFFLEECVRALIETGVLSGEPGAYSLSQSVGEIAVPATVQALLAGRIDRLLVEEKRLLQTAAVIGPEVPLPLLQSVTELPDDVLHGCLTHLQDGEFVEVNPADTRPITPSLGAVTALAVAAI